MTRYNRKRFCPQHLRLINELGDDELTERVEILGGYTSLVKAHCRGQQVVSTLFPHLSLLLPPLEGASAPEGTPVTVLANQVKVVRKCHLL